MSIYVLALVAVPVCARLQGIEFSSSGHADVKDDVIFWFLLGWRGDVDVVGRVVSDTGVQGFFFCGAVGEVERRYGFPNGLVGNAQWGGVGMNVDAGKLGRSIAGRQAAGDQVGRIYTVIAEWLASR